MDFICVRYEFHKDLEFFLCYHFGKPNKVANAHPLVGLVFLGGSDTI